MLREDYLKLNIGDIVQPIGMCKDKKLLKRGGRNVIVKDIIGEQADLLYQALTKQGVEISIIYRSEEEAINNVINAWNERKNETTVTLKPKTGHWIKHDTWHSIYYDCSLCGCLAPCTETADCFIWKLSNFCPDCGAKMVGEQKEVEKL